MIRFYDLNKNYEKGMQEWVTPSFSNEVFERSGVEKVFFLLLLLVVIGKRRQRRKTSKKLTFKGTLRQVFYLPLPSYDPILLPPLTH